MSRHAIQAVVFDAVGTLIQPRPSVAAAYAAAGRRHGCELTEAETLARFRAAFARQETVDASSQVVVDEQRELARWRAIVADVFPHATNPQRLFQELWSHFARPDSWALFDDASTALAALLARGLTVAIGSNFDERLIPICQDLPELCAVRVFVSSQLGARKPHLAFFAAIQQALSLPPRAILMVGDDSENDFQGARAAGWRAVLIDRSAPRSGADCLTRLDELPEWIELAGP